MKKELPAALIDGAALAEAIKNDVRARAAALGRPVHLTAILVGGTHAAELYANRQAEACRNVGIDYQLLKLPQETTAHDLKQEIRRLNIDPAVTGIMMHLPLPEHLNAARMQYEMILIAINDQPLTAKVAVGGEKRDDIFGVPDRWAFVADLGLRFSLWAPPRAKP